MGKKKSNKYTGNIENISRKYLILAFILFSLGILVTGYYIYNKYYDEINQKVEDEIISVSTLKIQEIVHWRKERMRNLSTIQNEVFGNRVKRTLENPNDSTIQNELLNWFLKFMDNYGYDRVCLHDMDGEERMRTSETDVEMPHPIESYYERIFDKKEIVFDEFYFDQKQSKIYLPLLVGMFDFKDNMKPLGTIICRIDPEEYLYPILEKWPVPRQSAKMHLVKKEGEEVIFLNQLTKNQKFRAGFSLNNESNRLLPAAKAVMDYTGIYESFDFNGDPVITYIQPVPDTPWKLIVKIDKDEAFKPVRGILFGVSSVVFLLIVLLGSGMIYIIRYQRYSYYKEISKKARELLKSEDHVRNLNRTLEEKVKERTADLEHANKELESFSYSVSHDLRAPLRHILGFAGILKDECLNESKELNSNLQKIIDSSEEMGSLIDHLLEYSRTGRMELKKSQVNMTEQVEEILSRFKEETKGRSINWQLSKLPSVLCDKNLLKTVWINLIENAVKYTSLRSEAEIFIDYFEKQNEYIFFVKDNGVGFNMSYSHKLFGIFQRLHLKKDFAGTGIGLANIRRIIARHGGRTWAEGEVDKGATFYFSLPKEGKKHEEF